LKNKKPKIKLLKKTSRSFLKISIALMILSSLGLYFFTKTLLQNEVEEQLKSTKTRVEIAIKNQNDFTFLPPIVEVQKVKNLQAEFLKDTVIFDPSENEMEEFRELSTFTTINAINHKITTRALVVESENILLAIIISYILILLVTFIILFYFNTKKNEQIWFPFFENLKQMKQFSVFSDNEIELLDTEILEFSELNKEMKTLTKKVQTDYKNLKHFTEDIAHEMQTPLAIIQAKIENFINSDELKDSQFKNVTSIQKDIHRLTQLNKKLSLLSKIENSQFTVFEKISITHLLEEISNDYKELTSTEVLFTKDKNIIINADAHLANILCSNLISNAIKYNAEFKPIAIMARDNCISIANYGTNSLQNPDKIFERYYRENSKIKSSGLGLTITKKICDLHGFKIMYSFEKNQHIFKIDFSA